MVLYELIIYIYHILPTLILIVILDSDIMTQTYLQLEAF